MEEIRITPEMMGEALGIPVQAVRVGIQQGKLDFGVAYKQGGDHCQRYTYVIFPEAARKTLGEERYVRMIERVAASTEDKLLKII